MKSKISPLVFLILIFTLSSHKSNAQSFSSVKFNSDSLLFDGNSINKYYTSGCSGKVSNIKGCAKIIKPSGECGVPGTESNASIGDNAAQGDVIKVCPKSMIEITLSDGSIMRGAPNSEINMSELNCEGGRSFSLRLLLGTAWSEVAPVMGGDTKYEVSTENAVVGSRGTKFNVRFVIDTTKYDDETKIERKTIITVLEGKVEVYNTNKATLTPLAEQKKITDDYENRRITLEEFTRKINEVQNNYKVIVEAGMETMVYNENPPMQPVRTSYSLNDFSGEGILGR
ncbi:MAG: FecR domain-containing protein [Bacteroidetes bacterium]|nr:FecR domain-containing protein [Bacteroidota bacterium]